MAKKTKGFGNDLAGDLYKEEPQFNMTALYYTILADVIRATFVSSLNQNTENLFNSVSDLIDISTPVLDKSRLDIDALILTLNKLRSQIGGLNKITNSLQKADETRTVLTGLRTLRRTILIKISPVLLATNIKFTPEGKLKEALGT